MNTMQTDGETALTVLVMGVCGSGKSTLARLLAAALDAEFVEADHFHSAANVARMSSGIALTDADRAGWLRDLNRALLANCGRGRPQVLACSALKASYRRQIAEGLPQMLIIFLDGSREVLAARLAARQRHFMPLSLLDSQLEILERPDAQPAPAEVLLAPMDAGELARQQREQAKAVLLLPITLTLPQALAAALSWLKS